MKSNNSRMFKILFPLVFLAVVLPLNFARGAMNDYCTVPPFLAQSIPPNVLIILDNSGSMCSQAYASDYDPTQFKSGYYYGYFDATKNYRYNSSSSRWVETTDAVTPANGTASNPIASGNFLNWATMKRTEVSKKILIGGKANPRLWDGTNNVILWGETGCDRGNTKDYDTSAGVYCSAGECIQPFAGDYRFQRHDDERLSISPITGGTNTYYVRPNADISFPSGWTEYPVTGSPIAWTKVNETPSDEDARYIQNANTTAPVIMDFSYADSEPSGTISVTVRIRAKRTAGGQTRRIRAVLQVGGVTYESNYSDLGNNYSNYSFTWANNPGTGAAWTWDQIKQIAATGNLDGFGVKAVNNYTSRYPRVTQAYLVISVTLPSGTFDVTVDQGSKDATGIVDSLGGDVRFGLGYYASNNEGGRIQQYVGFGSTDAIRTSIYGLVPSTWTPLGETLYEMTRYFRQDSPYYQSSDYSLGSGGTSNLIRDPYWYKYTDLSASLTDQYVQCAKSFVLFLTDGESTQDTNVPAGSMATPCALDDITGCSGYGGLPNPRFAGTTIGTTYSDNGRDYLVDVAYWARTNDMRPGSCTTVPTSWQQCLPSTQNLVLYSVFMFGTGSTLLQDAAIYGGFNDITKNNLPDCTTMPDECYRDSDGDGTVESNGEDLPLTYYEGDDGYALETSITDAITDILKRASSGTASSVLASGEGSGANIVQAIFYPKRTFETTEIEWTSTLQNLWYFIDPMLKSSSIREDTDGDKELKLDQDRLIHFYFDDTEQKTKADLYASDASGNQGALMTSVDIEDIKYLWEAGMELHKRSSPRAIYTTIDGSTFLTGALPEAGFRASNAATLRPYLLASSDTEAANIIDYVRGDSDVDPALYRNRTVTFGTTTDKIWKLGDVVNSTPRIASWIPMHKYDSTYKDKTYTQFLQSAAYIDRGFVFTGANDGMLHAFKLGKLKLVNDTSSKMAILENLDLTTPLGNEEWAFIPKNALPYLKHLMDKDYCHLYYIDATPVIFDASIGAPGSGDISDVAKAADGSSWRTILIGGMRLGGACKDTTYAGGYGVNVPAAGNGYSSYFALDITNQASPQLLWEFTNADLGFTTTGPAIVRISARNVSGTVSTADKDKNGKWFVVFASGPTGPIDTTAHQFKGYSDQNLRLFILDLKTGTLIRTIDTGIQYAFGGAMFNAASIDYDLDYQDDALYMGYVQSEDAVPDADTRWTKGGVIRLITMEDIEGNNVTSTGNTALNPNNWEWTYVAKDIGPVTTNIARLAKYPERSSIPTDAYLFFGSGRYFYKTSEVDNANNQQALYGVKEPCLAKLMTPITSTSDPKCTNADDMADDGTHSKLANASSSCSSDPDGWYINLDPSSGTASAERMITDPLASTIGAVFFTTYIPSSDICEYGGTTYLWAVKYDTACSVAGLIQGVALLQVSTGAIEEVIFKPPVGPPPFQERDNRRGEVGPGAPPLGQGISLIANPPPIKRTIHRRER